MKTTILSLISFSRSRVRRYRPRRRGRGPPRPGERAGGRREGRRRRPGRRQGLLGVLGRQGLRRRRRLGDGRRLHGRCRPRVGHGPAADRVELVSVGAGQVACVASTGKRSIDLLWHAQPATPRGPRAAIAGRRAAAGGLRPRPQSARHQDPIEPIARRRNGRELDFVAGRSRRILGRHRTPSRGR